MSQRKTISDTIASGQSPFFRLGPPDDATRALVVGVPFDAGSSFRPGARFGPYGVREASLSLGHVNSFGEAIFENMPAADGGNIVCSPFEIREAQHQIELQALQLFLRKIPLFFVGGDHSASFPLLQSAAHIYGPLAAVHFDAHSDTSTSEGWGSPYHHGTVFRNAIEADCVASGKLIQIGLRGPYGQADPHAYTRAFGGEVFEVDELEAAIRRLTDLSTEWAGLPVYVSVDVDVVDPAFAPATGTPVSGGLTPRELFKAIRALRGLNIIGFDVMEIAPAYDHAGVTALLGAHVLFEGLAAAATKK